MLAPNLASYGERQGKAVGLIHDRRLCSLYYNSGSEKPPLIMLNPLKWERVDQWRLFFAAAFGAALGFTTGPEDLWLNILCTLIGAVLVGGWFYYYRAFR